MYEIFETHKIKKKLTPEKDFSGLKKFFNNTWDPIVFWITKIPEHGSIYKPKCIESNFK
jgi:hypothetical protein